MIYAQMGDMDAAFQWLEKAYQDHEVEMYWLKVESPFELLRSMSPLRAYLRRIQTLCYNCNHD